MSHFRCLFGNVLGQRDITVKEGQDEDLSGPKVLLGLTTAMYKGRGWRY